MKILDEIADELNELLHADELDQKKLKKILAKLADKPPVGFLIIDFDSYDEEHLTQAREHKLKNLSEQNFEAAAEKRDMERECMKYFRFKKYFKLKKSVFYPEEYRLIYFYLGVAQDEHKIKDFLMNIHVIQNDLKYYYE